MADLEQNRQESLDLIQEEVDSMDVDTPLDNAKNAIDSVDHGDELDIKENFAEVCNILRNGTDAEKERLKGKLLLSLAKKHINMDYDYVTIAIKKVDGQDKIILSEEWKDGDLSGLSECVLINKGGKLYCESSRTTL